MIFKHQAKVLREILKSSGQRVLDRPFQPPVQGIPMHQRALLAVILTASPPIPSLTCITTENAEAWSRRQGNIYQDFVYSGALSNDLLFIQNWVNRNSFVETSKHCTVQWFHKQLLNRPLPAFPDKWSAPAFLQKGRLLLCLRLVSGGARGQGRWC